MKANLMNLTMSQLVIFTTTAKFENFSSAAKFLGITQPMVSRNIAQLENELGFELFIREKQHVSLTPAGRALSLSLASVTENLEISISNARSISQKQQGAFSICNDRGTDSSYYLYPIIEEFAARHPNVKMNIEQTDASWSIDSLSKGSADVAFEMLHETVPLDQNIFAWETIYNMPWCAYVHKNSHLYTRDSLSLEDLNNEPVVLLSPVASHYYAESIFHMFEERNISIHIVANASNNSSLSFAMYQGNGIVLANEMLAVPDHSIIKMFPLEGTTDGLCLVWKKNSSNPHINDFREIAKNFFKSRYTLTY